MVEVVALHDHVGEFQEGQAFLHALLVAFGAQHVVHAEAGANFTQQLNVVQVCLLYTSRGVDLFDCVMPSRNARHGHLFTWNGIINIKNLKYERDEQPIDCLLYTSRCV